MNTDCFAYKNGKCRVLKITECRNGKPCPFFKTKEQQEEDVRKVYARLASLDKSVQRDIADKYYKGAYPWLEVDDDDECQIIS